MGAFYTNITLRGPEQYEIVEYLNGLKRVASVSPTINDLTVVMDELSDSQDEQVLSELTADLSKRFSCPALAVLNHDDDILLYKLFDAGEETDAYNSCPDYFETDHIGTDPQGGNAAGLCAIFGCSAATEKVESVLRKPYVFQVDRHDELVRLLGLPQYAVGVGFNYLSDVTEQDMAGITLFKKTG
jgi:hypothetical protein